MTLFFNVLFNQFEKIILILNLILIAFKLGISQEFNKKRNKKGKIGIS